MEPDARGAARVLYERRKLNGTVLITGAGGFLGTYLARACAEEYRTLVGIDRQAPADHGMWRRFQQSNVEHADLSSLAADGELTACFHLAGGASVFRSMENPFEDFTSLLPGTARLLDFLARHQKSCHLVLFSSAAVYGEVYSLPVSETVATSPISPYGVHKLAAEALVANYAAIFGIHCSIMRIFSAYGAGLRKQVFWDVMRKYEAARLGEGVIELSGTGLETRDYIHASDVARAALLVARHWPANRTPVYNVANGEEVTLRRAVGALLDGAVPEMETRFTGEARKGDPSRWCADVRRLHALGFSPSVSLEAGLAEYREWFLGNGMANQPGSRTLETTRRL